MVTPKTQPKIFPSIRVIGVGGSGCRAINQMIKEGIRGVEFIAINSDAQSLLHSNAATRIQIGNNLTSGLGTGGNPDIGLRAAEESATSLIEAIQGADLVFIVAGLGGGTGTGAAPVVARIAKEHGALTIGIVTLPFSFEGKKRQKSAQAGLDAIKEYTNTLIAIPDDRLLQIMDKRANLNDAFHLADDILRHGVQGVSELLTAPGLINLDFADVRRILAEGKLAQMAIGRANGEERARKAAEQVISGQFFDNSILGNVRSILVSILGSPTMTMAEVNQAIAIFREALHPDVQLVLGTIVNPNLDNEIHITLIAVGMDEYASPRKLIHDLDSEHVHQAAQENVSWSDDITADLDIPSFLQHRSHLQGDSSTDAPPPEEKPKRN